MTYHLLSQKSTHGKFKKEIIFVRDRYNYKPINFQNCPFKNYIEI